jgi:N-acyl-D-aspartate/D-glutamate deacylase
MATHDLVIRGGTVVDGTGAPGRTADVAVDGEVITEVGRIDGSGRRQLDADGLLATTTGRPPGTPPSLLPRGTA